MTNGWPSSTNPTWQIKPSSRMACTCSLSYTPRLDRRFTWVRSVGVYVFHCGSSVAERAGRSKDPLLLNWSSPLMRRHRARPGVCRAAASPDLRSMAARHSDRTFPARRARSLHARAFDCARRFAQHGNAGLRATDRGRISGVFSEGPARSSATNCPMSCCGPTTSKFIAPRKLPHPAVALWRGTERRFRLSEAVCPGSSASRSGGRICRYSRLPSGASW